MVIVFNVLTIEHYLVTKLINVVITLLYYSHSLIKPVHVFTSMISLQLYNYTV